LFFPLLEQDEGGPSHSRFKDLGQGQQEDELHGREQHEELGSEAIGNKDGKDGEDGDDVEKRGEKRRH
jgi:hypothetical protein